MASFGEENYNDNTNFLDRQSRIQPSEKRRYGDSFSDSGCDADGDAVKSLPSSTYTWTVNCLESLGIYYNSFAHSSPSDILDIIYQKEGVFAELTANQKDNVKDIQNNMNYNYSMGDVIELDDTCAEKIIPEMNKDISSIRNRAPKPYSSLLEYFVKSSRRLAKHLHQTNVGHPYPRQGPVPEDVFIDMFRAFVEMCGLNASPGSLWRSDMCIQCKQISSQSDILIMPGGDDDSEEVIAVVSVVGINNSTLNNEENAKADEKPVRQNSLEPDIYLKIGKKTLGQHGGELLIHQKLYGKADSQDGEGRYNKYLPGMIVVGTEVTFTLMIINTKHLKELETEQNGPVERSCIYYSEPRDLLKKEDRDVLLEAFTRLCNIDEEQENEPSSVNPNRPFCMLSEQSIHFAALFGNYRFIEGHKENINDLYESTGMSPLMFAVLGKQRACIRLLLQSEAHLEVKDISDETAYHKAVKSFDIAIPLLAQYDSDDEKIINEKDSKGETPLNVACKEKLPQAIWQLLRAGADPGIPDSSGKLPIQYLVESSDLGNLELLHELHPEQIKFKDDSGKSLLHFAETPEMIDMLFKLGTDEINYADNNGDCAIHTFVKADLRDCVRTLMCHWEDVNISNKAGNVPLHLAVMHAKHNIAEILIAGDCDVNIKNNNGETPRHLTAKFAEEASGEIQKDFRYLLYLLSLKEANRCEPGGECYDGCAHDKTYNGECKDFLQIVDEI